MSDFADRRDEYQPPPAEADEPKWKFRARCCTCGELIEEFAETPKGLIPVGHMVPTANGKLGLQCEACFERAEAHKAE